MLFGPIRAMFDLIFETLATKIYSNSNSHDGQFTWNSNVKHLLKHTLFLRKSSEHYLDYFPLQQTLLLGIKFILSWNVAPAPALHPKSIKTKYANSKIYCITICVKDNLQHSWGPPYGSPFLLLRHPPTIVLHIAIILWKLGSRSSLSSPRLYLLLFANGVICQGLYLPSSLCLDFVSSSSFLYPWVDVSIWIPCLFHLKTFFSLESFMYQ